MVNTITGALLAAAIAFVSGALALLSQDGVNHLADISEKAWLVLGAGCFLNFLKDYNAIATRAVINKVTKSGDGGGTGPLPGKEDQA